MSNPPGTKSARPFRIDPFIIALLIAAALGLLLPASGTTAVVVNVLKTAAIALLFFLQGVRLERAAVIQGMTHWRLQLLTLASTFVVFPVLGFALYLAVPGFLGESLWIGVLFLCALPSTVQSSIAFTSIARGNVPAAVLCRNGVEPARHRHHALLVTVLLKRHSDISPLEQVEQIVMQLLVPFIAGQIASRWLRPWARRHSSVLSITDRGSIVLVVYAAFSAAVLAGAWSALKPIELAKILGLSALLLAIVLLFTRFTSRALHFSKPDEIAVVFCGSKKSLATGVPMANILFPATVVGLVILPIMVFHQLQLMVCAFLARRYAEHAGVDSGSLPP
ncbi:MAG: bile acid:sodium symporter family protein [Gammaproteobacteria bacterium]